MKTLVAGVGNVFFGDDGFGVEVARRLALEALPVDVKVSDYGIRGVHLAFELVAGYERAIVIDAVPRGAEAGTLYIIEPDLEAISATPDSHSMELHNVFAFMKQLEGPRPHVTIVGCEPASANERMELSEPVRNAIEPAVALIKDLLARETTLPITQETIT
ncbi:MAG TPA: hydrogenase maturation protease [Candidatus Baltobacteraceae bacterium]|jgi:hydrogenase maturation protease